MYIKLVAIYFKYNDRNQQQNGIGSRSFFAHLAE